MNAHVKPETTTSAVLDLQDQFYDLRMAVKLMGRLVDMNFANATHIKTIHDLDHLDSFEHELSHQSHRLSELTEQFEAKLEAAV